MATTRFLNDQEADLNVVVVQPADP